MASPIWVERVGGSRCHTGSEHQPAARRLARASAGRWWLDRILPSIDVEGHAEPVVDEEREPRRVATCGRAVATTGHAEPVVDEEREPVVVSAG